MAGSPAYVTRQGHRYYRNTAGKCPSTLQVDTYPKCPLRENGSYLADCRDVVTVRNRNVTVRLRLNCLFARAKAPRLCGAKTDRLDVCRLLLALSFTLSVPCKQRRKLNQSPKPVTEIVWGEPTALSAKEIEAL